MGNDKLFTVDSKTEQNKSVEANKDTSSEVVLQMQQLFRERQKKNDFSLLLTNNSADQFLPQLTIGDKTETAPVVQIETSSQKVNLNPKFGIDAVEMAKDSRSMIQQIRVDGNEGAIKYFGGLLPCMDSTQLAEFDKQFAKSNGRTLAQEFDALKQEGKLSPASAEILQAFLLQGKELRTADQLNSLAQLAVKEPNSSVGLVLLASLLGGNSQTAVEARKLFSATGGENLVKSVYTDAFAQKKALDVVQKGEIDSASLIRENLTTGSYFTGLNDKNIDNIVQSMTAKQRSDYLEGKRLTSQQGPVSSDQEAQIAFYNDFHSALADASTRTSSVLTRWRESDLQGQRKLIGWEATIQNGGKPDLLARITANENNLAGVKECLRTMTPAEWQKLKDDKSYRESVERGICATFNGPDTYKKIPACDELQRIWLKNKFEDIGKFSSERFFDEMGWVYRDPKKMVALVENGDSDFAKRIKSDETFRRDVLKNLDAYTPEGSVERELCRDSINAILENRVSSKFTELKRLILKGEMNHESPIAVAATIKTLIKENPEVMVDLANPEQYALIKNSLTNILKYNNVAAEKLLNGGGLTVAEVESFASTTTTSFETNPYNPRAPKVISVSILSKEEAINGLTLLDDQSRAKNSFGDMKLSSDEQDLAAKVMSQGSVKLEDIARMYVLHIGSSPEKLQELFGKLTDQQKAEVQIAYQTKFGGNLTKDVLARIDDPAERCATEVKILASANTNVGNLSRNLQSKANAENVSPIGKYLTETLEGNTYEVADKRAVDASTAVKDFDTMREKLSPQNQAKLDEAMQNLQKASADIREGKKDAINKIETAIATVATIISVAAIPGGAVSVLAYVSTAAALSSALTRRILKGSDYSDQEFKRDVMTLGATIVMDAAPAISQIVSTLTKSQLISSGRVASQFRDDLTKVIQLSANDQKVGEQALQDLCKRYAPAGKAENLYAELKNGFEQSTKQFSKVSLQGQTVDIVGSNDSFILHGFDPATGRAIVSAKNAEVPTAEFLVKTNTEIQAEGYRTVSGTNLYVKGDEVYRSTVIDGKVRLSKSEMSIVESDQVLLRAPMKYAEIPSLMSDADKAAIGPKAKFTWTVTPGYRKEINQAISNISPEARQLLEESGVSIFAPRRVIAQSKELGLNPLEQPRGYLEGSTLASCSGFYSPADKQIVVAKRFHDSSRITDENGVTRVVREFYTTKATPNPADVMRHEVGHAVDDSLGGLTTSKAYKEAYEADLASMPQKITVDGYEHETAKYFEYFIQEKTAGAGANESFAELFSAIYRGGKESEHLAQIEANFPRCAEVLRQRMNLLKEEMAITSYLKSGAELPASDDYVVSKLMNNCTLVKTRSGQLIFYSASEGKIIVKTADGVESTIQNGVRKVTKTEPTSYSYPNTQ